MGCGALRRNASACCSNSSTLIPAYAARTPAASVLHVGVVARVVLGHEPRQPGVVPLVGGLPRLPVAQRRVRLGHLDEPAQDEVELDRHRLLAPQRAVVVEHRDITVPAKELLQIYTARGLNTTGAPCQLRN